MAKDPMGEIMRGRANPDGLYRYGSDAHLAAMREQARRDEANRARISVLSRPAGRQRVSQGAASVPFSYGGCRVLHMERREKERCDASPSAIGRPAGGEDAAVCDDAKQQSDRGAGAAIILSDIKRIEYERQNQPDWERRLGPVRVRTIKAPYPTVPRTPTI